MPIENDKELAQAVIDAGLLLQEIQDYARRDFSKSAKVRFPRGYLRTADQARSRLDFLENPHLKSNISYMMLLSDVQHWLLVRTDLDGIAKEMIIKLQFFLLGTIAESLTKTFLKGKCGKNYKRRTEYLKEHGIINEDLRLKLDWIWEMRNKMHLFRLEETEWSSTEYTVTNLDKAVVAFKELLTALNT